MSKEEVVKISNHQGSSKGWGGGVGGGGGSGEEVLEGPH